MSTRKQPSTREQYAAFYPLQTRWIDNDIYGHMNNVVHYSLFDTAVNGWLIENDLLDPHSSPVYGLVVETGCKYFQEMGFPDRVTAGLRVAHFGSSSVKFAIGLFRNDEESAAAEGFFVHVYVDRERHQPAAIPKKNRVAFEKLQSQQIKTKTV